MSHFQVEHRSQRTPSSGSSRSNASRSTLSSTDNEKRKSIVFMAAEAVQQERDTIRALKRLSMGGGGSLELDPELSIGIENELESFQHNDGSSANNINSGAEERKSVLQRRKSASISSLSSETSFLDDYHYDDSDEEEENLTPAEQNTQKSESRLDNSGNDEDIKVDAEKLLWVPATAHPSIAPDKFKRHVQDTLDDMSKKITGSKRTESLPSLQELTDELEKLSQMAGLEANDAITLARSLSSASSSSHLLLSKENSLLPHGSEKVRRTPSSDSVNTETNESEVDEDAPIFASANSLKRNKWNTYSRQRRAPKEKPTSRNNSPLSESKPTFEDHSSFKPEPLAKDDKLVSERESYRDCKRLPHPYPQSRTLSHQQHTSQQQQHNTHGDLQFNKRHLERNTEQQQLQTEGPSLQQRSSQQNRPSFQDQLLNLQQRQRAHRRPSLPHQPQQRSSTSHDGSQLNRSHSDIGSGNSFRSQDPHQQHHQSSNLSSKTNHSRNRHAGSAINLDNSNSNLAQYELSSNPYSRESNAKSPSQSSTSSSFASQPSHSWKTGLGSQLMPKGGQSDESMTSFKDSYASSADSPPQTPTEATTPSSSLSQGPVQSSKKESKSKEFLNLFKMKRSTKDKKSQALPSDENSPFLESPSDSSNDNEDSKFHDFQQEFQQHQQAHKSSKQISPEKQTLKSRLSPQRPALTNGSSFKLNKQNKISQDSSKARPKNLRLRSKNQINTVDGYSDSTKYAVSHRSPTSEWDKQSSKGRSEIQQQQHQEQQSSTSLNETQTSRAPIQKQKEELQKKLSMNNLSSASSSTQRANAPVKFTDSPFGFPLPPLSHSTIIMLDYRFPIHIERALYRLSHLKLANAKRPLRQQVLLSNFMYAYLNLVNHTLYLQQLEEGGQETDEGATE